MNSKTVRTVKVRSAQTLIEDFVKYFESRPDHDWLPLLRIATSTQALIGTPTKIDKQGAESWLVLLTDLRGESSSVSFLPMSRIETVTILNPEACADILSRGDKPLEASSAPSRLELERDAAKQNDLFFNADAALAWKADWKFEWNGLELDGAYRAAGHAVLQNLKMLTAEWMQDPMGKSALKELTHIYLTAKTGEALGVQREGPHLRIVFGNNLKLKSLNQDLKTEIESKL